MVQIFKNQYSNPMPYPERNFDDDSYHELEEDLRNRDPDEEDRPYFPPEESKPPHH